MIHQLLQSTKKGSSPLAITVITLLFIGSLILIVWGPWSLLSQLRRKRYPPGPMGLPVIGNLFMMGQLTHRGLAHLAREYGPLLHMKMGFVHVVVVSGPEEARQVLQAQDIVFSKRPATAAANYLTYGRADMVFANYGMLWRQMRKLCVVRLFSRKRDESWQSVRDEIDRIVSSVAGRAGLPANLGDMTFNLSKNMIYRAAFGSGLSEGQDDFIAIMQEFSNLFAEFNIADFIPLLTWVDPNKLNDRLKEARARLDQFIDKIIDDHIRKKTTSRHGHDNNPQEEEDMVDGLLDFHSTDDEVEGTESNDNSIKLSRDNIKGIIMDMMFGGTETVGSIIEWAMAELLRSPEYLKQVQQELTYVVGLTRRVNESDLEKLTFFRCCIKETLRLHPPVPILLHETAKDAVIGEYHIPKQARVMINVFAIGRDPNSWPDPDAFNPTRFLCEQAPDFKGRNFEYIPFGSGRRACPGMQLALYALEMCVANLLHCFTWELPGGMKTSDLNMDDVAGLSAPRATRLVAVPKSRLLCPL